MGQNIHSNPPIAFETHQLTVNYGHVPALWDISLEIPEGNIVGIIGPNGAGKSTLLKTALGLIKPLSGRVQFYGKILSEVRSCIAYVPQKETVDWDFPITVRDLVLMGRYGKLGLFRRPKGEDYQAAAHYLDMVGMKEYSKRQIGQLSGGQQQRVFIARAFIQQADIYFMDEPFTGIDLASRNLIMELLRELKKQGKTIFVVHHELDQAASFFDWMIMLNIRLVACGPTKDVFNSRNLNAAYGKNSALLDAALKLSTNKSTGVV